MSPEVTGFFDERTANVSYVIADPGTKSCAVIDTVLNFDARSGCTGTEAADALIAFVRERSLETEWVLETHCHADHLTAAAYLKEKLGGRTGAGAGFKTVQETWKRIYNLDASFPTDGSQFDHLFEDGETFAIGGLEVEVWHTPGHTPSCVSYVVGDAALVGDTMFMPDLGTARTDFPGGDAATLYRSIRRILSLPPETRIFINHDYPPEGRGPAWETTVADERAKNPHIHDGIDEAEFVEVRTARDKTLAVPQLLFPSIQVNIRGGCLPEPEANGTAYLKIPLNAI